KPTITSASTASATEHQAFSYTATATDPEGNALTFTFSDKPAWLTASGAVISGTPPEGATNTSFKVTVSDGSLTDSKTVTLTVTPVNDPPVITSPLSVAATEHQPFSYTATATDPEGAVLTFTFEKHPAWLAHASNPISGIPVEGTKDTSFVILVSDGTHQIRKTVTVTVAPVNDPPVILSPDSAKAFEDKPFSYKASAQDPENDVVFFKFENMPSWMTVKDALISGTPGNAARDTSFIVIASDSALTDTLKVTVTVEQTNDPPRITSKSSVSAAEKSPFIYTCTINDEDGPPAVVTFKNYPSWLTAAGSSLSGTPPKGTKTTQFMVIACDRHPENPLSDTLYVMLTVVSTNQPPVFDKDFPAPVLTDIDSLVWSIQLDPYVSDPDDPDSLLKWTATVLDNRDIRIHIDDRTRTAQIGIYENEGRVRIALTVRDPYGASVSDTLSIDLVDTGVSTRLSLAVPETYALENNYPNPFNPLTRIRYGLPKPTFVDIRIYDMMGREAAVLVQEKLQPGMYEAVWDAAGYPSGVYICRIVAGEFRKTRRLTLMK
ncbi:VCBS domain-containing protein, partial [bacterium]|nr:VCBS domain-containing protein [bacterium]